MKIKVEVEIDSDNQDDSELVEQLIELLKELKEK